MSMRTRITAAGVAGLLGVAGLAVVTAPLASAVTDTGDGTVSSRLEAIKDALAGLVSDGSITQEQADEVATTLDGSDALRGGHGPGGHGGRGVDLSAAAETLGMTAEELRTALQVDGTTLADVAATQGVETQTLVDALVAAGTERIGQAVTDGRLTQAEADEKIAALPERVTALVEEELRFGGRGHGPRGGHDDATGDAPADGTTAEDGTTDPAVFSSATSA